MHVLLLSTQPYNLSSALVGCCRCGSEWRPHWHLDCASSSTCKLDGDVWWPFLCMLLVIYQAACCAESATARLTPSPRCAIPQRGEHRHLRLLLGYLARVPAGAGRQDGCLVFPSAEGPFLSWQCFKHSRLCNHAKISTKQVMMTTVVCCHTYLVIPKQPSDRKILLVGRP